MRVILINIPWTTVKGYSDAIRLTPPIGIAYVASYLREHNINVKIIDALAEGYEQKTTCNKLIRYGLTPEQIASMIWEKPDFIGISCPFTSQSNNLHDVARALKNKFDVPIIAGGAHISALYEQVLKDKNIDIAIIGEGEETFLELTSGRDLYHINGIAFRAPSGDVIKTSPRTPITRLDKLPYPAYDLLPLKTYWQANLSPRSDTDKKWMPIVTSRGCPYNCCFCSVKSSMGSQYRYRSAWNVINEIAMLKKLYGIEHIFFEDDNLSYDINRAQEIFRNLSPLNITWETPNGIRADKITPELLTQMKASGCKRLTIAVESGDQNFLNDVIRKKISLEQIEKTAKLIRDNDIDLTAFYIFGITGETEENAGNTINFARKLARLGVRPYFNVAVPLPNTELYNIAKTNNLLTKNNFEPIDYLTAMQIPLLKNSDIALKHRKKASMLCAIELLLNAPRSLLKSESFVRLKKSPLKALKIFERGTC